MNEFERIVIETEARSKSNSHRLEEIDEKMKSMQDLTLGVQKIAINTENIAKEQKRQGDRLDVLEAKPAKRHEVFVTACITTVVGAGLGALVTALINML